MTSKTEVNVARIADALEKIATLMEAQQLANWINTPHTRGESGESVRDGS